MMSGVHRLVYNPRSSRLRVWMFNIHLYVGLALGLVITLVGLTGSLIVYKPETERASHYFRARLADQFDAVIHVDTTTALTPLERWSRESSDLPETYPTGV